MPITKTSWPTGLRGNPRGRPRSGEELGPVLRETVDRKRFAEKLCELRNLGDVQAMRLLLSYTDGLPVARAELSDSEGIQITVTYVQQNNRMMFSRCGLPVPRATARSILPFWSGASEDDLKNARTFCCFAAAPVGLVRRRSARVMSRGAPAS